MTEVSLFEASDSGGASLNLTASGARQNHRTGPQNHHRSTTLPHGSASATVRVRQIWNLSTPFDPVTKGKQFRVLLASGRQDFRSPIELLCGKEELFWELPCKTLRIPAFLCAQVAESKCSVFGTRPAYEGGERRWDVLVGAA